MPFLTQVTSTTGQRPGPASTVGFAGAARKRCRSADCFPAMLFDALHAPIPRRETPFGGVNRAGRRGCCPVSLSATCAAPPDVQGSLPLGPYAAGLQGSEREDEERPSVCTWLCFASLSFIL